MCLCFFICFLLIRRPPESTRTDTPVPYTPLVRPPAAAEPHRQQAGKEAADMRLPRDARSLPQDIHAGQADEEIEAHDDADEGQGIAAAGRDVTAEQERHGGTEQAIDAARSHEDRKSAV